jgi:hypothetical protein
MRPFNVKLLCWIGLLACFAFVMGCGSGDLLDTIAFQYSASMVPMDGDTLTDDIDIYQSTCASGTESFYDLSARVTVETDSTASSIRINRYVVYVTPLHGVYSPDAGASYIAYDPPELSPALTSLTYLDDQVVIDSNGKLQFDMLIWPHAYKLSFRNEISAVVGSALNAIYSDSVYSVHVDFYATDTENNQDVTFEADMSINLLAVSNC